MKSVIKYLSEWNILSIVITNKNLIKVFKLFVQQNLLNTAYVRASKTAYILKLTFRRLTKRLIYH